MSGAHTYTSGIYLTAIKPITKGDMVTLCEELNNINESGIKFQPEPITEGGISYNFPHKSPHDEYKSIRMDFENPKIKWCKTFISFKHCESYVSDKHFKKLGLYDFVKSRQVIKGWPSVHPNVMELWKNDNEVILEAGLSLSTFLKAFHGAPVFTENELKIFGECAEKIGLIVSSKYPKDKQLISYGQLGEHRY